MLPALLGGCVDFVEPDLPAAGAPAVFQAIIHVDESGRLQVSSILLPGLSADGIRRTVPNDTIRVYGLPFGPTQTRPNGARTYEIQTQLTGPEPGGRPLTLAPPAVSGSFAPPTSIQWQGVRRLDPDTIVATAGTDIVLHIELTATTLPAPDTRSWSVDLVSTDGNFRFGANGVPPASIRIPSFWIPNASNGRIAVVLTFFQSGAYRPPPGDYSVSATADVRVGWNLRLLPTPQP